MNGRDENGGSPPAPVPAPEDRRRITIALIVLASYAVVAAAFLSPLASDRLVPGEYDYRVHINAIGQAAQALQEGQFPIRVAPGWNDRHRYPLFQFYSPLPYTLAGLIHRHVTPHNAFLPYRLLLFAALVGAGLAVFALATHFVGSGRAAYLAGIAYMTAPYLIVNIHARSAWTEVIAQGIVPAVLLFTVKAHATRRLPHVLAAGIWWFALCTTHTITFVYTLAFVALFMVLTSLPLREHARGLLCAMSSVVLGCALAFYYLGPVLTVPLRVKAFTDPYAFRWLTPIFTLLSPVSIAPEPGPDLLSIQAPGLHASVGWVALLAAGYVVYAAASRSVAWRGLRKDYPLAVFVVFGVAFFMAWSPLNFWRHLPKVAWVTQYPYRMLSHVAWSGALLFAYAVRLLYDRSRMSDLAVLIGVLVIGMSHASWLRIDSLPSRAVSSIANEKVHQDAHLYQWRPGEAAAERAAGVETEPERCSNEGAVTACFVRAVGVERAVARLPVLYYPRLLSVEVNGRTAAYFPVASGEADDIFTGVQVGRGDSRIEVRFTGSAAANAVSLAAWIGMVAVAAFAALPRRTYAR